MSIADQITRIKNNIAASYAECSAKGATLPTTENSENLPNTIASITTGGGTGGGEEITAYNYTSNALTQGAWVHYNERVDNTAQIATYNINGLAYCYCVAPDILLYSSGAYNPNTIFTATLNESDNTYVASQVGSISGYPRRFCGIDKDGYLYSNNSGFSSLNYEKGLYWGNGNNAANSEYYLDNEYLHKIDKLTGNDIAVFDDNISYVMQDVYGGYSISSNILVVAKNSILTIVTIDFGDNSLSQNSTNISCGCIIGGMSNGIIFGQVSKPSDKLTSALLAFKYENGALITYSKENFPSAMQECFDNDCNPFWNEQYGIFTAYIPSTGKCVCCQYINGMWVDRSPILDVSGLYIATTSQFMVSSDFSRAFLLQSGSTYLQFSITSASDGNYLVPYSYTNSESKMGKVKDSVLATVGAQCTVVIPKVETNTPDLTPDPTTMELQLWRFNKPIESHHLFSTHSEIFDAEVDFPEDYRLIPVSSGHYPLLYRSEDGYVYSYNGASDNTNTVTWQKLYNWGTNTQPKSTYYYGNNGGKIAAVNTNKFNADWSVLVQDIKDINNVKKFKISGNYQLTYIESGYTYINGVTTPTIVACSTSSMAGFYISTDDGENWKSCKISDKWDSWNQGMGKMISQVLFSKGTIFVLFGANYEEIYKSSDCGETWQKVEYDNKLGVYTSNYQWQGNMTIKDGYNEYLFFPNSTFTFGYLWDGSNFQKISFNNTTYSGYEAVSIPQLYSALIYRNGLYKIIQLDDQGFHEISSFTVWKGTPKTVLPPVCIDYETISTLINMGADVEINQVRFPRTYTKKFPPEVGDKTATFATKQDEFWTDKITSYTDGLITTSTYGDDYKYKREPRGDVTLG